MKRIGLIVNPIAGLGGRVGLKGTDGAETVRRALELGAAPEAPVRAARALEKLLSLKDDILILTYPGPMGEDEALSRGFRTRLVGRLLGKEPSAADTRRAAREILDQGADLLLFCGGDGTARDIHAAVGSDPPVVGIPAGVKMHSGVFAVSPSRAGEIAADFLNGELRGTVESEVLDIDEEAYRRGEVRARLFGYLRIPEERIRIQGGKVSSPPGDRYAQQAIGAYIADSMTPGVAYILGPGTTVKAVADALRIPSTLLGIDAVCDKKLIGRDLAAAELMRLVDSRPARLIVSPIGGQGHILGRGNQQLSPEVIRRIGRGNIIVLAAAGKLASLHGRPLMIDTGDPDLDTELSGYFSVVTGYGERAIYPAMC